MDWKLLSSTFFAILLAEMGDKTQLATMSLAAGSKTARWSVGLAAAAALVTSTVIAVLAGEVVARYVPPIWIKRGAGALFLVLGLRMLLSANERG